MAHAGIRLNCLRVFSSVGSSRCLTLATLSSKSLTMVARSILSTSRSTAPDRSTLSSPSSVIATWKKMLMRFRR